MKYNQRSNRKAHFVTQTISIVCITLWKKAALTDIEKWMDNKQINKQINKLINI